MNSPEPTIPLLDPAGASADATDALGFLKADYEGQIAAIRKSNHVIEFALDGTILDANDNFLRAMGYRREEIIGRHHRLFVSEGDAVSAEYISFWRKLGSGEFDSGQYRRLTRSGQEVWLKATYNPIFDAQGRAFKVVKYATDVTEQHQANQSLIDAIDQTQAALDATRRGEAGQTIPLEGKSGRALQLCQGFNELLEISSQVLRERLNAEAQDRLWRQANFDGLTGLPNRQQFHSRIEQQVLTAERTGEHFALLFIDLDEFKDVNDTLGHEFGDMLLISAARRLLDCVRKTDVVCRLGGDEFTVILTHLRAPEDAGVVASQIGAAMVEVFELGEHKAFISASIGITCYPSDGLKPIELIRNADTAMYAAKAAGRNGHVYFDRDMQAEAQFKVELANELREAIDGNLLELAFQPIIELANSRIAHAEVLLRWRHPTRGMISPAHFIPVAERARLIGPLSKWVFEHALKHLKHWRETVAPDFRLSINVSPLEFSALPPLDEPTPWRLMLDEAGLPGNSVILEITEGLLMEAGSRLGAKLQKVCSEGMTLAIDDFGTGYSSLAYLRRFAISMIKIDRSFIQTINGEGANAEIAESIIVMARKMGIEVVAEGVETLDQHYFLKKTGCHHAQGYWYAKPMKAESLTERLATLA